MISVIIPIYNTAEYLKRCIDSVLCSLYEDYELLLIDDGSTDHSGFICKEYCKKDCRVKYFRQENKGVSAARNKGIKESRGTWLIFVDSDDFISPDFLGMIAEKEYQAQELLLFDFIRLKKRGGVSGSGKAAKDQGACIYYKERDKMYLIQCLLNMRRLNRNGRVSLASACAKAYKKSVIDRYQLRFAEDLVICEDRLFNFEYLLSAASYTYIQKPVYFVEMRMGSAMRGYTPFFLQNDIRYQKRLHSLLKSCGIFTEIEEAYYNGVLSNMTDILVRGIFHPGSTRTYKESCIQCSKMQKMEIYKRAVKYNKQTGSLPRKILLFFYQRKEYRIVKLICRTSYRILGMAGQL